MKAKVLLTCIFVFLAIAMPGHVLAQDKPNYASAKFGAYFPSGDLDDADFDTGFSFEGAYGYRFTPNFALEGGIGYFESDASDVMTEVPGVGRVSGDVDISVVPLTVTAKGIMPAQTAEFYGGVGLGIYLVDEERDVFGGFVKDDDDAVFGGHFLGGASFEITPLVALGIEMKYIFTDEAELFGTERDLNGFFLMGNVSFSF